MKAQRYPASIIRVGAVLYSAFGWTDDEGKCHLDLDEWHVRSMQNRTVSKYFGTKRVVISLVQKAEDITWQKDNWLTNFPAHYRKKFYENEPLRGLRANDVKNHVNRLTYCFILIIRCCIYSYSNDHGADGRWNAIPSRGQFGDRKFLYVKRII